MLILGIILVVAGAVVGLGKMPRQKKGSGPPAQISH